MNHFNIKLPHEMRQQIDFVAAENHLSRAEVVRAAVAHYLRGFEIKKSGSCEPQKGDKEPTRETARNGKE